ncbi:MAG: AAC(3) family N-acetyltransferase [Pseudomonadota bacterium]
MIDRHAPLFVHSDMARGMVAAKRCGAKIDPRAMQESLRDFLVSLVDVGREGLIFPAFNYDYGAARVFDVANDPVQVGQLAEWMRQSGEMKRTRVPFFSFLAGADLELDTSGEINPFGAASGFQHLLDSEATLVLFGAPLASLTFIHFVEEMTGGPAYRYVKRFPGTIIDADGSQECDFAMHVRPMGVHLDYDWPRLEADLRAQRLLHQREDAPTLQWLSARALMEYWGNRIAEDPFYLIDQTSRDIFAKVTDGGRTRVQQADFEPAA